MTRRYKTVMALGAFIKAHRELPRKLIAKQMAFPRETLRRVAMACSRSVQRAFKEMAALQIAFPIRYAVNSLRMAFAFLSFLLLNSFHPFIFIAA